MASNVPIKVGMIGVGVHATKVLLPALYSVPQLDLVAVATSRDETAKAAEQRLKRKAYVGYKAMLNGADIEGVLVVGGRHEEEMLACLEAGKHVFCETPAITTEASAEKIIRLRDEKKKVCMVGSCLRFSPVYQKMKSLVEEWRIEHPGFRMWQVRYYPYVRHFFNLLLWLNGKISSVYCFKGENEAMTLLRFANGDTSSVIWRNFHNNNIPYEEVEVSAMSGCLRVTDGRNLAFWKKPQAAGRQPYESVYDSGAVEGVHPTFSLPYGKMDQLYLRGYIPELEEFARLIREPGETTCSIEDMEATRKTWTAVEQSAREDGWVKVGS